MMVSSPHAWGLVILNGTWRWDVAVGRDDELVVVLVPFVNDVNLSIMNW